MAQLIIHTPHAQTVSINGCSAKATWNPDFARKRTERFDRAQCFIDAEVLRRCSPRVPFRDGFLEKSGAIATEIGSGEVRYATPYAARLYNNPQYNFDQSKHANAGGQWFERMKIDEKNDILHKAAKIAGGT
ncbi:MAG: minor capsid protein [Ruthenibacterium sp.]